ncbi:hypothetical protein LAC1533_0258 [Ligilactobacillus acidipiscis]|uniref:Uncharacterized protein n=1 Tax=Ligilactobacillus acidipiscis TaxID=89059 RepID=A0A1K1KLC2_9LACO|nr:hypothetical protein LAC1533_0258 [Ligilactobacillus acidipiscis]
MTFETSDKTAWLVVPARKYALINENRLPQFSNSLLVH